MMNRILRDVYLTAAISGVLLSSTTANADDFKPFFDISGLADVKISFGDTELSTFDGGFGKTREGDGTNVRLSQAALIGFGQLTPSLSAVAHIQYNPDLQDEVDIFEAFLRYRPVSTGRVRYTTKLGAFIPHVSAENKGRGWTNLFTLTNSAANTWIAEEVRPLGLDFTAEYRGDTFDAEVGASVFINNDNSGAGLALRGFVLNDQNVGIFGEVRIPDVGMRIGQTQAPFREGDDSPGFAVSARLSSEDYGEFIAYYSDNGATAGEPFSNGGQAWDTRFLTASYNHDLPGGVFVNLQGLVGTTETIANGGPLGTNFSTISLLLAKEIGDLQLATRGELFDQNDTSDCPCPFLGETGEALTVAATYRLGDHHRFIGEYLHVSSDREGATANQPASFNENVFQLAYRLVF
ncbi:hypothetical protein [Kordiimonas sp. SCSIO 12610]|uniref:hypothetical protein n=1 Tax=Kordiimonas sp. SCSIO 12610 TaxID=2829597 RepID=UPI002108C551|nr:hypothetical protein [Kordiimonas sp. SCSIO 12610]UTW55537.1 hypothetical protein KFF44_01180 [Kordiimonas sp. SCSIO 12610]